MSAAPSPSAIVDEFNPETVYVSVDGFEYQVIYTPKKFGGVISHFEFRHWMNGEDCKLDCPLTETGYRSQFFTPSIIDDYESTEAAAIASIERNQNMKRYLSRENERKEAELAARQMTLF